MTRLRVLVRSAHPAWTGEAEFDIDFATGEIVPVAERGKPILPGLLVALRRTNTADNVVDCCLQAVPAPYPLNDPVSLARVLISLGYEAGGALDGIGMPPFEPTPPGAFN